MLKHENMNELNSLMNLCVNLSLFKQLKLRLKNKLNMKSLLFIMLGLALLTIMLGNVMLKNHQELTESKSEYNSQIEINYAPNNDQVVAEKISTVNANHANRPVRIFCMILSTPSTIESKGKVIYDAWANECDMVKFVLKFPDHLVKNDRLLNFTSFNFNPNGAIDINNLLEPDNLPEESGLKNKLTIKVYRTLVYLYSHYNGFDWYLKADQDTFVFMNNLRRFLSDKNSSESITYGYNFAVRVPGGYHSGGAGYVLSHAALMRIGKELRKGQNNACQVTGVEDLDVGMCSRRLGILMGNSTDELGRERFHLMNIKKYILGHFPKWLFIDGQNAPRWVRFYT